MKLLAYSMHPTEAVKDDIDSNVPTISMEYTSWIKGEFPEKFKVYLWKPNLPLKISMEVE